MISQPTTSKRKKIIFGLLPLLHKMPSFILCHPAAILRHPEYFFFMFKKESEKSWNTIKKVSVTLSILGRDEWGWVGKVKLNIIESHRIYKFYNHYIKEFRPCLTQKKNYKCAKEPFFIIRPSFMSLQVNEIEIKSEKLINLLILAFVVVVWGEKDERDDFLEVLNLLFWEFYWNILENFVFSLNKILSQKFLMLWTTKIAVNFLMGMYFAFLLKWCKVKFFLILAF